MRLSSLVCVCGLLVLCTPETGYSQGAFWFSYKPDPGHLVTIIFESEGVLRLDGVPGYPDGARGQYESMASVTERVRDDVGEGAVISITYDSSFAQYRVGPGWVDVPAEWNALGPFLWLRDENFITSPLDPPDDPFFINVARGLQWTASIPLPESPVDVNQSWSMVFDFPVTTQIPSDSALLITVDMIASGSATLDSIVARPADSLMFVTLDANLTPTTVSAAYSFPGRDLPVGLSGSVEGSYIWSTGWFNWVSSTTRVNLSHQISGVPDATMLLTVTARSRIRP